MSCRKPHETPCSEVLERVYWFLDGEVSEDDSDRIRQHLDECGPCLREYGLEEAVKRLVAKHTDETETPIGQSSDDESIGVAYIEGQLRLIAIRADGTVRFLDPRSQCHGVLYVASLELQGLKSLIGELEDMMNSDAASEADFQRFFERNPEFLCGDTYEAAHPHIVLQRPGGGH